ncbi:MAG: hypothetical protein LBS29_04460 [Endomicrobium sp.]|jgi:hypothetical protein|nr:hypothetical protein [Endomicrobium sp.]
MTIVDKNNERVVDILSISRHIRCLDCPFDYAFCVNKDKELVPLKKEDEDDL